jgi:hypothetical protein
MSSPDEVTGLAVRLARFAAVRNAGILSCPYPPDAAGPASAARRTWLGEYRRLRPAPVDYGDHVTALAAGPDSPDDGAMPDRPEPDLFRVAA